jgi:hypothetical protein
MVAEVRPDCPSDWPAIVGANMLGKYTVTSTGRDWIRSRGT